MKPQLLFISLEHWDEVWRRNQFFAVRMAADFQVTFIGPELPIWKMFLPKRAAYKKIRIRYIYKLLPERFFSRLNQWVYSVQYPKRTSILWINDHTKYFLLEKIRQQKSVYDITDDWTLLNKAAVAPDRFLCQAADTVVVCSRGLFKTRKQFTKNIVLIKNGINLKDYVMRQGQKKYFLYTGSLHEDRLDVSLMITLAKAFPQEQFVYVGPVFMQAKTVQQLQVFTNIKLLGAQPYAKMSTYMAQAKALIVPHRQTPFVNSLDPIKQYEYMLSEVPVISTDVSGFNEWPKLFTVVAAGQFISAIRQAIHGKIIVSRVRRRQAARSATWEARYKQVKGILCLKK